MTLAVGEPSEEDAAKVSVGIADLGDDGEEDQDSCQTDCPKKGSPWHGLGGRV